MPNTNNIILNINGQNNTGPAFQQVQTQAQQTAHRVQDAFMTVGNSMKSVGKAMTAAITLPTVGVLSKGLKEYKEVEQVFAKVSAFGKIYGEDLQDLKEKAEELAKTGVASAQEVGEAYVAMGQAGWGKKQMLSGIDAILRFSKVTNQSMEEITPVITRTIGAFHLTADQVGYYTDVLAAAAAAGNAEVADMAEAFNNVASTAAQSGSDVRDVAAALSILSDRSIIGSQAGTYLARMLNNLNSPTTKQAKALQKYGIEVRDAQGNIKSLRSIMIDLRKELGHLSKAEQAVAISEMFDDRAAKAVSAIITASEDDFNKYISTVYSASDGVGAVTEMYNTIVNTLSEKTKKLQNIWSTAFRKMAESIIPTLSKVIDLLQKLGEKLVGMKPETLDLIVKIGLVVAAIGPLLIILGSIVTSIIKIKTGVMGLVGAFKTLGTTFSVIGNLNPWVWIIAGIIVLVTVLTVLIIKNWDKIKETWKSACDFMSKKWREFCDWIKPGLDKVSGVFKGIAKKLGIEDELKVIGETIKKFKWWDFLLPTGGLKIVDAFIRKFLHIPSDYILKAFGMNSFEAAFIIIKSKIELLKLNIIDKFKEITQPIVDVWKKVVDGVKSYIDLIKKIIMSIIAIVWHIGEKIIAPIQKVLKKVFKTIQTVLRPIKAFIRNLINNVKEVFVTGFNYIKNKVQGIFGVISNVFKKLKSFYGKVVEVLRPVVTIVENFKKGFETIMDKIVEIFMSIYEKYEAFVEKFRNFIADVKKDLCDFINAIINGINHLTSGINKLKFTISGVEELGIPDINWDFNIPQIDNLPSLSIGTSEVLKDGLAVIHKGEAVVPAQVNPWRNDVVATNGNRQIIEVHITDDRADRPVILELDSRTVAESVLKRANVLCNVRG